MPKLNDDGIKDKEKPNRVGFPLKWPVVAADSHHTLYQATLIYYVLLKGSFYMAGYQGIESSDLYARMSQGKVLLVDVRNNEETSRGVIHGALCIPLHLLPLRLADLAGEEVLVFYCHSGVRSAHACSLMANQGRSNIYNLRGGILAWGNAGYSLERKN